MTSKSDVIDAIRAGQTRVQQTFGSLSDEDLARVVHPGDGGWTAKEVLAHLAGRAAGYQRTLQAAGGSPQPLPAGFDVDHWNRERIAERIDNSRDDLLNEFTRVHDDLIQRVEQLDDNQLQATIQRPTGELSVAEALARMGGQHSINHSEEVERALAEQRG